MNIAKPGCWKTVGRFSDSGSERERRTGERTIQHPPGAGTPRKKCFQ